ncbi:antitermination protein [Brenneria rubrifaciens]|uniref:Antitermination protein n=1 Tax=Brenneria rubrifaciens TaxID=55213 RepID=A0A4P8QKM8_9GAMM|nr:antitermination protein [Brenneria rubrifaciens]QCR07407.1 antitermination protein [Brenneria rubrifaciens]
MDIEYALSLCGPKSASAAFTCREAVPTYGYRQSDDRKPVSQARREGAPTAAAKNRHSDILLALGVVQSREGLGLSLILARYDKDPKERKKAIEGIARFALKQAPALVGKAAGRQKAHCMVLLAKMAVEQYCRTADDPQYRCRCGGRGEVTDLAASKARGETVKKICPRCGGSGLKPPTSSTVYKVIKTLIPELTQRTWSRNWKVFYDALVSRCHQEAGEAEQLFSAITSSSR